MSKPKPVSVLEQHAQDKAMSTYFTTFGFGLVAVSILLAYASMVYNSVTYLLVSGVLVMAAWAGTVRDLGRLKKYVVSSKHD